MSTPDRKVLGWLAAVAAAILVAGTTGLAGRAFDALFQPTTSAAAPVEPIELVARQIRVDLERHVAEANGLVTIWREDRAAAAQHREAVEQRLSAIDRKLDAVLYRLDRGRHVGAAAPSGSAPVAAVAVPAGR